MKAIIEKIHNEFRSFSTSAVTEVEQLEKDIEVLETKVNDLAKLGFTQTTDHFQLSHKY